jgi:hypothetical protein
MAWTDYQKAFEGVLRSWIIISLELIGLNIKIISFTKKTKSYWETNMRLYPEQKRIEIEGIEIERGVVQRNSLSPMLFHISLIPSIEQLNKLNAVYLEHITKTKLSPLLYTDDLKLTGKTEQELQNQLQTVNTFSDDNHTEFGLDKGAKIVLKKGKLAQSKYLILDINREIQGIEPGET